MRPFDLVIGDLDADGSRTGVMVPGLDFFIVKMISRRVRIGFVREWYHYPRKCQRETGRVPICGQGRIPDGDAYDSAITYKRERCAR
jgi:hypothetical protein